MIPPTTALIVARNAGATIERALRSAVGEPIVEIVLVDDWSEDGTAERARSVGDSRLRIVTPITHRTLGFARQTAIDALHTPFGIWLDADDEWLPGRANRLVSALEGAEADFSFDGTEIVSALETTPVVEAPIPEFMFAPGAAARLFERSYVPTLGVSAFRTDAVKALGFDATFHGAEDYDLALRAVAAGSRFHFVDAPGYRIHANASSISRQSSNQRVMCRRALAKHSETDIAALYTGAGFSARVTRWALVSIATFREDYWRALDLLDGVAALCESEREILEPNGPEPWPEGWRILFTRGTLSLLLDQLDDAIDSLRLAERLRPTAEGANNLAVALKRDGRHGAATPLLVSALERRPDYADARANLAHRDACHVTTHPLRRHKTRTDCQVERVPHDDARPLVESAR